MSRSEEIRVSEIRTASDIDSPKELSFFDPYLEYSVKEVLGVGGEAHVARTSEGSVSGIFIYDDFERTGTVYTRSREVFDYFYDFRPFNFLWAEMRTEHECETYDIYSVELENLPMVHRFSHQISIADEENVDEIERFMVLTHPGINRRWVRVALEDGDKCFTVRLNNEMAGLGWLSMVNGIGRLDSLYVRPQFRGIGIGDDLVYARLLWLKSKRARSAFSEISRHNISSAKIAVKGHMGVAGQVFLYFKEALSKKGTEELAVESRF